MTKESFLHGVGNWNNHLHLLYPALEATTGLVVEFGCGDGSTKQLHQYCDNRKLRSYDSNDEWLQKYKHFENETHKLFFVKHWDDVELDSIDVLLIDHAPGERRKVDLGRFANIAKIIVIHDSEPVGWNSSDYQVRPVIDRFKYKCDLKSEIKGGAWATAVSNFIDVRNFL